MFFKNLQLYRLAKPIALSAEDLHVHLLESASRPCGSLELATYGWVPPLGRQASDLCHSANGYHLICARREEKILPAGVVREQVESRAAEIEEAQARKVRRKERLEIRDEVLQDLMPKALVRSSLTFGYLSPEGWLVIDAASPKKAEDFVSLLRSSLGSLPAVPPAVREAPASVLTRWVAGEDLPADFALADECELRELGEGGGTVRCKRLDLGADEIQGHLQSGKQVIKLATIWDARLSCLIGEDLSIKRLRFEDVVQEQIDVDNSDAAARFDAEFVLMTLEHARFIRRLIEVLGGEDEEASRAGMAA